MTSDLRVSTSHRRGFKRRVETGIFDAALIRFPTIGARGVRTMAASFEYLDSFHNGLAEGEGALLDHCVHVVAPRL